MNPTLLLTMMNQLACHSDKNDTGYPQGTDDTATDAGDADGGGSITDSGDTADTADTADTGDTGTWQDELCAYISKTHVYDCTISENYTDNEEARQFRSLQTCIDTFYALPCADDVLGIDACLDGQSDPKIDDNVSFTYDPTVLQDYIFLNIEPCDEAYPVQVSSSTVGGTWLTVDGSAATSAAISAYIKNLTVSGDNGIAILNGAGVGSYNVTFDDNDVGVLVSGMNTSEDHATYYDYYSRFTGNNQTAIQAEDNAIGVFEGTIIHGATGDSAFSAENSQLEIYGMDVSNNNVTGNVMRLANNDNMQIYSLWFYNNQSIDYPMSVDPYWDYGAGTSSSIQATLIADNTTQAETIVYFEDSDSDSDEFTMANVTLPNNKSANGAMNSVIDLCNAARDHNFTLVNLDISNNTDVVGSSSIACLDDGGVTYENSNRFNNGAEDTVSESSSETLVTLDPQYASGYIFDALATPMLDINGYDLAGTNLVDKGSAASGYTEPDGSASDISFLGGQYGNIAEGMKTTIEEFYASL